MALPAAKTPGNSVSNVSRFASIPCRPAAKPTPRSAGLVDGTASDQYGIRCAPGVVEGNVPSHSGRRAVFQALTKDQSRLGGEDVAGQFLGRCLTPQPAASLGLVVNQHDGVPQPEQVVGGGESRWAGTDDDHLLAGRRGTLGHVRCTAGQIGVGYKLLEVADGHGAIGRGAATALLARLGTDSPQDGRQRNGVFHGDNGLAQALAADLAKHQGDVHVGGAGEVTRCQAIAHVIAEQQFQGHAAGSVDFRRLALHDHAIHGPHAAGRDQPVRLTDLHQAHQARGCGRKPFHETERRNVQAKLASGVQQGGAFRDFDFAAVDGQVNHVISHSLFVIRHSLFVIRYSSLVIRHSTFVIRHSLFDIRYSLAVTDQPGSRFNVVPKNRITNNE